jgi:N-acetylneuraminic acid mutarotase
MNVLHLKKMKKLLFIGCLIAVTFSSCTSDSSYTLGVWEQRSDFDGVARSEASSFMIDGNGYICCGYNGKNRLYDLWKYNVSTNSWTQRASLPESAKRNAAVGFSVNGKGYITTGYNGNTYLKDTWEYNPSTNEWTQKADFAGSARYCALSFAIGNYGYVGTGYDDNYLKDFYRYDPTADKWEIMNGENGMNSFSGQKRRSGTAFVIDDIAYVCCGQGNGSYVYDFWKFDPKTGIWSQLRDIAATNDDEDYDDDYAGIVREKTVSFVIDGKAYMVTGSSGSLKTDYWVYDPSTDLWSGDSDDDYTAFKGSARYGAVGFSTGTKGFVVTGGSSSLYFDDMWELLPYEHEEE